jgi:hypothetical protein
MDIGLLKFYHEGRSLRGNSTLLQLLIHHWYHARHGFRVSPYMGYHPIEEDVYFITGFSRRGVYFPHFPMLYLGVVGEICQSTYYFGFRAPGLWWPIFDRFISKIGH